VGFYEILFLAKDIPHKNARTIESLMKSIISVTQTGNLSQLPHVAEIQEPYGAEQDSLHHD